MPKGAAEAFAEAASAGLFDAAFAGATDAAFAGATDAALAVSAVSPAAARMQIVIETKASRIFFIVIK